MRSPMAILALIAAWQMPAAAHDAFTVSAIPDGAVSITEYGRYRDGADWAPAFRRALGENDHVFVPQGQYVCSQVSVPSGKHIEGCGDGTLFLPIGTSLFTVRGSLGREHRFAVDAPDHARGIRLTDTEGLAEGDDILIISQRNCMLREGEEGVNYDREWVLGRTRRMSLFFGEFDVIAGISGDSVTTRSARLFPSYFHDSSREPEPPTEGFRIRESSSVYRIDMVHDCTLENFAISGTARCTMPIDIRYARDCTVEGITFRQGCRCFDGKGKEYLSSFHASTCLRIAVRNCRSIFSESLVADLWSRDKVYELFSCYNVFRMISCWESGFDHCSANCATHAFSITRSASSLTGICGGDCYIRFCKADRCIWSGVTVQQGVWHTVLEGNVVTRSGQGICCAGRSAVIRGNTLSTDLPHSTSYYYTHVRSTQRNISVYWGGTGGIVLNEGYSCGSAGHRVTIEGNRIHGFRTGIAIRDGYEKRNIFEEGFIDITGNSISKALVGIGVYRNAYNTPVRHIDVTASGNRFSLSRGGVRSYVCKGVNGVRVD